MIKITNKEFRDIVNRREANDETLPELEHSPGWSNSFVIQALCVKLENAEKMIEEFIKQKRAQRK